MGGQQGWEGGVEASRDMGVRWKPAKIEDGWRLEEVEVEANRDRG